MTATERSALIRGVYNAAMTFGVTFFTSYLTTDVPRDSLIIAAIAAFGVLGFRAGGEGAYDSMRDKSGNVQPSDVGYRHISR